MSVDEHVAGLPLAPQLALQLKAFSLAAAVPEDMHAVGVEAVHSMMAVVSAEREQPHPAFLLLLHLQTCPLAASPDHRHKHAMKLLHITSWRHDVTSCRPT
eukprot:4496682-Amphidinium_carterae.1